MSCELLNCCPFFNDHMQNMPKSAEYIKNRLCLGDFAACTRYRIFKSGEMDDLDELYPEDASAVKKVLNCRERGSSGNRQ